MAGVAVDDLRAVDCGLLHGSAALAEGMGVDDEHLVVELVIKLLGAHAAHIGIGAEPLLIDAIDQIVVVIFREAQLSAQDHVQAHFIAPLFGGVIAAEVVVHHRVPIVLNVDAGQVLRMQMVRDHKAREAVADIAVHHVRRRKVAALAGLRGMGMGVIEITIHFVYFLFIIGTRARRASCF